MWVWETMGGTGGRRAWFAGTPVAAVDLEAVALPAKTPSILAQRQQAVGTVLLGTRWLDMAALLDFISWSLFPHNPRAPSLPPFSLQKVAKAALIWGSLRSHASRLDFPDF